MSERFTPRQVDSIHNPGGPDRDHTLELIASFSKVLEDPRADESVKTDARSYIESFKRGYEEQAGEPLFRD